MHRDGWMRRTQGVWGASGHRRRCDAEPALQLHPIGNGGRGQQLDQRELGSARADQPDGSPNRRQLWRWTCAPDYDLTVAIDTIPQVQPHAATDFYGNMRPEPGEGNGGHFDPGAI